jgi:cyclic nucleotide gated channel
MACWHTACKNDSKCISISFKCNHSLSDLTFLEDKCSVDTSNTTGFDYGIFLGAIQSGNLASTDFLQKLAYCFWWGLRNLRFGHATLFVEKSFNCLALTIARMLPLL